MAEPLSIDVAGAQVALDAIGGMPDEIPTPGDPWSRNPDGTFAPSKPADAPIPVADETPAADATTPPAAETVEPDPFTHIDDASLTPELLQLKRSLQADYTRKTQEVAPWRKLGQELGVETPEDFRTAAEVYQRLQDPRNWPTIHGELTEYMSTYGMNPQQASQAAADQLAQFAPVEADPEFNVNEVDPGIAPLMQQMQAQAAQIKQLTDLVTGDRTQQAQQAQWNAVAQKLTAEENQIKAANPQYGEDEIAAIYNLMGPEGDLLGAERKFAGIIGAQLSKYIASKSSAVEGAPAPVPGGGVIPATPAASMTPDEAHRAAMAHVAALEAAAQ